MRVRMNMCVFAFVYVCLRCTHVYTRVFRRMRGYVYVCYLCVGVYVYNVSLYFLSLSPRYSLYMFILSRVYVFVFAYVCVSLCVCRCVYVCVSISVYTRPLLSM